ncbi:hypothetical protein NGM37_21625, partial [Streptomyces sp. TRM76130]|nr:hypothetical protein [Streptomyces sp. TRM76130]
SLPGVTDRARRTGQARLDWLVTRFRERLEAALDALADGREVAAGPSVDDFTIRSRNRGCALPGTESSPELRRRAVFVVDPRPGLLDAPLPALS